jgi:hypothetical protein
MMNARLPALAVLLGAAGLIPFLVCALAAISSRPPGQLNPGVLALVGYGAVILSFLGGVHWGFVLDGPGEGSAPKPRMATRLLLGVVPALIGWAALLASAIEWHTAGLAILIVGYVATVLTEWRWRKQELLLPSYMILRSALTVIVVMILVTVLTLRLVGATIVI